jgi:hypothetical protein
VFHPWSTWQTLQHVCKNMLLLTLHSTFVVARSIDLSCSPGTDVVVSDSHRVLTQEVPRVIERLSSGTNVFHEMMNMNLVVAPVVITKRFCLRP